MFLKVSIEVHIFVYYAHKRNYDIYFLKIITAKFTTTLRQYLYRYWVKIVVYLA